MVYFFSKSNVSVFREMSEIKGDGLLMNCMLIVYSYCKQIVNKSVFDLV